MPLLDSTLSEYGKSLGFSELSFSQEGVIQLEIDGVGALFFERNNEREELLIYLAQEYHNPSVEQMRRVLEVSHPREDYPQPIQPGLFQEKTFLFCTRLQANEVTLPSINDSVELLKKVHTKSRL